MKGTKPCPDCNGQGRHSPDPKTGQERVCQRCEGSGAIPDDTPNRES